MSRLGGDQAVLILSEALNEKDPRVVEEAVRGLGRLQVKEAVPALLQLASGSTGNLLQAIFEALGDIGDKSVLSTLEQAITNPDKFIEVEVSYASGQARKEGRAGPTERLSRRRPRRGKRSACSRLTTSSSSTRTRASGILRR